MDYTDEKISGSTLAAQITDRIRDDIINRRIKPGSRITAREIADKYGVSSMPVREAFNMLCGENLLELNPYKGAVVIAVTPELVAQLNDLQCALESLLVELCMKKGYSEELLSELEDINREMAELKDDEKSLREHRLNLNVRFHKLEYSPCKDHMAYALFERNLKQLAAIRRRYELETERAMQTLQEHQQIIQALRNGDVLSAVTVTRLHTLNSKRYALSENYE